jgi:hypothetical protein
VPIGHYIAGVPFRSNLISTLIMSWFMTRDIEITQCLLVCQAFEGC